MQGRTSWQWTPASPSPSPAPSPLLQRHQPSPLMRSSSNREGSGQSRFNLFTSLRRSFREHSPFSRHALSRQPTTPRPTRVNGTDRSPSGQRFGGEGTMKQQMGSSPSPLVRRRGKGPPPPPPSHSNPPSQFRDSLPLSEEELCGGPPSAEEAREDLYFRLQALLTPATTPAPFPKRRQNLHLPTKHLPPPPGASEVNRIEGVGRVESSQESLMSLMSSSNFGPASPIPGRRRRNPRSVSSGSSKGSFGDLARKPPLSVRSFPHSVPDHGVGSSRKSVASRRSSALSGSSCSSAIACPTSLPVDVKIRPLFDLETSTSELDSPFLGREWLFREVHDALLRTSTGTGRAFVVMGSAGSGKTTFMKHVVRLSPFHTNSWGDLRHLRGSMDSGIASGSRLSLNQSGNGSQATDWAKSLGSRIVGYHFCRIDTSETCSLPEFVSHLGAQLAVSPLMSAYAEVLSQDKDLQSMLQLENCLRKDPLTVFKQAIAEPLNRLKPPENGPFLILVDAVDESEFHKLESGDSLSRFMTVAFQTLPSWLRFVVSIGPEENPDLSLLECRRVNLDDTEMDQRIWMDAKTYVDFRLQSSFLVQQILAATGLPDNYDPLQHFTEHMVTLSRGNLLYLRLTMDLLERGQIRLRTANYGALPVNLQEVFLLIFNLKFPSALSFDRVIPILSLMLASLSPLTPQELHSAVNAGRIGDYVSWEDFCDRLLRLGDFLVQRSDDSYVFSHPSFREWLQKRDGRNPKFLADLRQGHILLALKQSRRGGLEAEEMLELGHHLLKSHPYKHLRHPSSPSSSAQEGAASRECQILWLHQSARDILTSLTSEKNIACPNIKVSRLLLIAGASPDALLKDGTPLICRAAEMGQAGFVSLLIEFGANINSREKSTGRTPLMLAAATAHLDLVQILHQHNAPLCEKDDSGKTALGHAGESGHVNIVSFLLQCDWGRERKEGSPPEADLRRAAAQSTFVQAARKGQTKVCEFLLEMAEVGLEEVDPASGQTALCAACASAQAETAQFLMRKGAIMAKATDNPSTGRDTKRAENEKKLEEKGNGGEGGEPPLICAVTGGSWEIVSGLLARGLDANSETNADGFTPLMAAAKHGHIGVLELLLSRGADVDRRDKKGGTALLWACDWGQGGCAALLLDRGAHVDAADQSGQTSLHLAARGGDKHLVQILLDRGAKFELPNSDGLRPLDIAVRRRNTGALQCFLRRGAKLGSNTWELAEGSPEIIVTLLQKLHDDASLLYKRGRLKDASHRYSYALKKLPNNLLKQSPDPYSFEYKAIQLRYAFHIGLGRCKRRSGEIRGAVELCEAAIATNALLGAKNRGFEAYFLRARCKFDLQDIHGARADAEEAVNLSPSSKEARQLLQSLTLHQQRSSHDSAAAAKPPVIPHNMPSSSPDPILPEGDEVQKSTSPAECSSDSGNQADFDELHSSSTDQPRPPAPRVLPIVS